MLRSYARTFMRMWAPMGFNAVAIAMNWWFWTANQNPFSIGCIGWHLALTVSLVIVDRIFLAETCDEIESFVRGLS